MTRPTLLPRTVEYESRHDLERRAELVGQLPVKDDCAAVIRPGRNLIPASVTPSPTAARGPGHHPCKEISMPVGWLGFYVPDRIRLERDQRRKLANRPDRGDRAKVKAARKARRRSR